MAFIAITRITYRKFSCGCHKSREIFVVVNGEALIKENVMPSCPILSLEIGRKNFNQNIVIFVILD